MTDGLSALDRAAVLNRNTPLSAEELKGVGVRRKRVRPPVTPFVKVYGPDREDGRKGWTVEAGVRGTM